MLQAGAPDVALAARLDRAYYELTATTDRHFSHTGAGWFLTGVAGLDAITMNRAVVEDAGTAEVGSLLRAAESTFGERDLAWSVVLSSFRDAGHWHGELLGRGLHPSSTLDVLARAPGPLAGEVPEAEIRLAHADEVGRFTEIMMDVFRMPRRFFPALLDMTDAWRRSGSKLYFAELDGEPVATALLARIGGIAGVYNVGTMRAARGRGIARALMARCFDDSLDADVVTLQVAPEGFVPTFYLGMGFEPVYRWRFYSPRRA